MSNENTHSKPVEAIERFSTANSVADDDLLTISKKDARSLLKLFDGIAIADSFFHNCQSHPFREHVRNVYKSNNVAEAFRALRESIESGEKK